MSMTVFSFTVYASVMYKTIADCFVDTNNRFTLYIVDVYIGILW